MTYPGVGPDGIYRLHSGVVGDPRPPALPEQLTEGGHKLVMPDLGAAREHERRMAKIKLIYGGATVLDKWPGPLTQFVVPPVTYTEE